jgi:ribosomal protein S18 acetylase RimI-like enzyme
MQDTSDVSNSVKIKAVLMTPKDLPLAASLLFVAYRDDPIFQSIFEVHKSDYEQRLRAAIREELNAFWDTKQPMIGLFSGRHLLGVACLIEPQKELPPNRFWHWRLKMMLNAGYISTKNMIEKEQRVAAAIPYNHYHLLTFIAIHPDHQHQGLGKYLVRAVDSYVNDNAITEGVAVFVTKQQNLAMFEHDQFSKLDEILVGQVEGTLMFKTKHN